MKFAVRAARWSAVEPLSRRRRPGAARAPRNGRCSARVLTPAPHPDAPEGRPPRRTCPRRRRGRQVAANAATRPSAVTRAPRSLRMTTVPTVSCSTRRPEPGERRSPGPGRTRAEGLHRATVRSTGCPCPDGHTYEWGENGSQGVPPLFRPRPPKRDIDLVFRHQPAQSRPAPLTHLAVLLCTPSEPPT